MIIHFQSGLFGLTLVNFVLCVGFCHGEVHINLESWFLIPMTPQVYVKVMVELASKVEEIERSIAKALEVEVWWGNRREAHARVATIFRGLGMHKRQYQNERA